MDIERIVVRMFADSSNYNRVMTGVEARLRDFARMSESMGAMIVSPFLNLSNVLFSLTRTIAESGYAAVQAAAHYEVMGIQLELLAQNTERGKQLMKDMFQTAVETPFQVRDVVAAGKEIAAFGFEVDDIIPVLKTLGDISAATGTPMHRLILAFGQARVAGRLMGQEMRQFVNANVPLMEHLAKVVGKPQAQIKKMIENGQIGFDKVVEALNMIVRDRFPNIMDRINQTTQGQWTAFTESLEIGLAKVGTAFLDEFDLRGVFSEWRQFLTDINPSDTAFAKFFRTVHSGLLMIRTGARFAWEAVRQLYEGISGFASATFAGVDLRGMIQEYREAIKVVGGFLIVMTSLRVAVWGLATVVGAGMFVWRQFVAVLVLLRSVLGINAMIYVVQTALLGLRLALVPVIWAFLHLRAAMIGAAGAYATFGTAAALAHLVSGLPAILRITIGLFVTLGQVMVGVFAVGRAMVLAYLAVLLVIRTAIVSLFVISTLTGIVYGILLPFSLLGQAIVGVVAAIRAVVMTTYALSSVAVIWKILAVAAVAFLAVVSVIPAAVIAVVVGMGYLVRAIGIWRTMLVVVSTFTLAITGLAPAIAGGVAGFFTMLAVIRLVRAAMISLGITMTLSSVAGFLGGIGLVVLALYQLVKVAGDVFAALNRYGSLGDAFSNSANELSRMVDDMVGVFQTAWEGIESAIAVGDFKTAVKIAFEGLKTEFHLLVNALLAIWEHFRYEVRKTILGLQMEITAWWFDVRVTLDPSFTEDEAKKRMKTAIEEYEKMFEKNKKFNSDRLAELDVDNLKRKRELEEMVGTAKENERLSKMTAEAKKLEGIAKNIADYSAEYVRTQEARIGVAKEIKVGLDQLKDWTPPKDFEFIPAFLKKAMDLNFNPVEGQLKKDLGIKDTDSVLVSDLIAKYDNQFLAKMLFKNKEVFTDLMSKDYNDRVSRIREFQAGYEGRKQESMQEYTKNAMPMIGMGLATNLHLITGNMDEFVRNLGTIAEDVRKAVNQIPEHYTISAEAKTVAEKYAQKHLRGVGEETNQYDFFIRETKFIEEARTGLVPELQTARDSGSEMTKFLMKGFGEKFRALDEDQAEYSLLSSFDKLKKYVGDRTSTGPKMMLEGTSEAQDTINRTQTQQVTVLEQIRQVLMTGQAMQQSHLSYAKEAVDALRQLTTEKQQTAVNVAPMPREIGFVGN